MSDMTTIQVHELPDCDFCGEPAPFDDKTTKGPWANMCESHQKRYGFNIGTKRELIVKREPKVNHEGVPTVTVPMIADEGVPDEILAILGVNSAVDTVQTVKCPWCDEPRRVEVDANYLITCEACGKPYRCRSQI